MNKSFFRKYKNIFTITKLQFTFNLITLLANYQQRGEENRQKSFCRSHLYSLTSILLIQYTLKILVVSDI